MPAPEIKHPGDPDADHKHRKPGTAPKPFEQGKVLKVHAEDSADKAQRHENPVKGRLAEPVHGARLIASVDQVARRKGGIFAP
jgi:hypothetical protein